MWPDGGRRGGGRGRGRWVKSKSAKAQCRRNDRRRSIKKLFLKISQKSQENTCARVSFLKKLQDSTCNYIKKETLAQVFSRDFCEIFKNIFFTDHLRTTASASEIVH